MRVLWFTNTFTTFDNSISNYNGCGWVDSLAELIKDKDQIKLGISFLHPIYTENREINNIDYFPILRPSRNQNPISFLLNEWSNNSRFEKKLISKMMDIISEFKPDIIHIFGTEGLFNSVHDYTKIPIVVHLQGIINPIINSYFPVEYNLNSLKYSKFFLFKNLLRLGRISDYYKMKFQINRESKNLRKTRFVMGRTDWDRRIVKIFNPKAFYFHLDEVLRTSFYQDREMPKIERKKIILTSTISSNFYKGIDVILKTANLLKHETILEFEWNVIGVSENDELLKLFISKTKIQSNKVNVKFLGIQNSDELVCQLSQADIYIHPSYIDNSPNSLCEAQIIGLPVIACNVGGLASLIEHKISGILIPSNGIFELVSWIVELSQNHEFRNNIASKGKIIAKQRHDKKKIADDLLNIYSSIKNASINFHP